VTISELTERELVQRIQQHLPPAPSWIPVGIGDDAAVVEPARNRLEVLSVDALVEGVHFDRRFTPPAAIGHRALAVNLSDLAAMGAEPRLALLSFALPAAMTCDDFDAMTSGLASLAARHRVHVAGGNLTRSPGPLMIDVTVAGVAKRRQVLTRSGARPGDDVFVSGTVGTAAAGLKRLHDSIGAASPPWASGLEAMESSVRRFLYPEPRVRLGLLLGRNRAATACVDLSDGLADAARQIAGASGVGMEIDALAVPLDRTLPTTADLAVAAGDDYELLFTVSRRARGRLRGVCSRSDVPVTRIGVCTADPALVLHDGGASSRPLPHGYGHFR
jgi:thiamine-monophosphate kinase